VSLEAITLVRTLPRRGIHLAPRDRFVLYALADFADDRGEAWPSHKTITEWTGYARATVIEALAALEEDGMITATQRRRDDGGMTSKVYRIEPHPPVRRADTPVRRSDTPPSATRTAPVREPDHPITPAGHPPVREPDTKNHHIEPPSNPQENPQPKTGELATRNGAPTAPEASTFLEVWNAERGPLPAARSLNPTRTAAIARLKREHGADALDAFTAAVRCVSRNDFYIREQHGLDALLRPGKVQQWAERYEAVGNLTAGERKLATTASAIWDAIGGHQ
jgi:hypothetical protein